MSFRRGGRGRRGVGVGVSFAWAAVRYWLGVFPWVWAGRRRSWARASRIPDPRLRGAALEVQRAWGNLEGAAAAAAFVPVRHRVAAARAMASFQAAYDYLDMLGEQPCGDPAANGRCLHGALLVAIDPDASHGDYYEHHSGREDGGYLRGLVEECRGALATLPSYPLVAGAVGEATGRIVEFQSCNTGEQQGDLVALEQWARALTPRGSGLCWWETAAGGGSSLGVFALIALAARPVAGRGALSPATIAAVKDAYFPWIGALHSLLDNLVDIAEDYATGQRSLVGCYASSLDAATRMRLLAERALNAAEELPDGRGHVLVLAAMASFYLSTPEASAPAARPVAQAVLEALGEPARLSMLVFRSRLRLRRLTPRAPGGPARRGSGAEVVLPAAIDAALPVGAHGNATAPVPRGHEPYGVK
jgi:tetraprenyl-beta-curcumene synthase